MQPIRYIRHLDLGCWNMCIAAVLKLSYKTRDWSLVQKLDLLVGSEIIVELKAVDQLVPVHKAQLLTYLKLTHKRLGLLINFNVPLIKDGIVRLIL